MTDRIWVVEAKLKPQPDGRFGKKWVAIKMFSRRALATGDAANKRHNDTFDRLWQFRVRAYVPQSNIRALARKDGGGGSDCDGGRAMSGQGQGRLR